MRCEAVGEVGDSTFHIVLSTSTTTNNLVGQAHTHSRVSPRLTPRSMPDSPRGSLTKKWQERLSKELQHYDGGSLLGGGEAPEFKKKRGSIELQSHSAGSSPRGRRWSLGFGRSSGGFFGVVGAATSLVSNSSGGDSKEEGGVLSSPSHPFCLSSDEDDLDDPVDEDSASCTQSYDMEGEEELIPSSLSPSNPRSSLDTEVPMWAPSNHITRGERVGSVSYVKPDELPPSKVPHSLPLF